MSDSDFPFYFLWANRLYGKAYFLYRPIYFLYKGISDRRQIKVLSRHVRPGMTALDIGANIGYYSLLLSRRVGARGKVHCFEPEETNFKHLFHAVRKRPNVVANQVAIGERDGLSKLYLSGALNTDHHTYDDGEGRTGTKVKFITVDGYFTGGETVDFIKMDIQGYEHKALLGMRETLRRSENVTLVSEFWPFGLKRAGSDPLDYLSLLASLGFKVRVSAPGHEEALRSGSSDRSFYTDLVGIKTGRGEGTLKKQAA
jgi:FkbM family methyltransferase